MGVRNWEITKWFLYINKVQMEETTWLAVNRSPAKRPAENRVKNKGGIISHESETYKAGLSGYS